mmetsp:Transcript_28078/g.97177  ORF Transcript_28078/g.97177 Transcript_28078/m.97177 type:complete len:221 (-) Transcript_28078:924-1586(-)
MPAPCMPNTTSNSPLRTAAACCRTLMPSKSSSDTPPHSGPSAAAVRPRTSSSRLVMCRRPLRTMKAPRHARVPPGPSLGACRRICRAAWATNRSIMPGSRRPRGPGVRMRGAPATRLSKQTPPRMPPRSASSVAFVSGSSRQLGNTERSASVQYCSRRGRVKASVAQSMPSTAWLPPRPPCSTTGSSSPSRTSSQPRRSMRPYSGSSVSSTVWYQLPWPR